MKRKLIFLIPTILVGLALVTFILFEMNEPNKTKELADNNFKFGEHQIVFGKISDNNSSLVELEKNADFIVIATKLNDEVNKLIENTDGRIDDGYTLSKIKIKEVLQKKSAVEISDELEVYENEFYNSKSKITYHTNGYEKMEKDTDYLLFLRKSKTDSFYLVTGLTTGKIRLSDSVGELQKQLKSANTVDSQEILQEMDEDAVIQKQALKKFITHN